MSAASMPFPPGTVLAGKYRVDRLLGEGGMGWVVVATHLQLEQRVALKFMRAAQVAASPDAVARFLREARAAARIQSEHVARVSDVGTLEDGAPYLVMEYLEGQDLDSLLQSSPRLPVATAVEYAMQACEGLSEVHAAGIIHRDLKPANLFLARRTDGSVRVKLLDFGISKVTPVPGGASDGSMTSTQALMGSPLYMAPEQMRSSKSVDARADIWSMGVILYEMFAGRSPFGGDTLPEVCARIMTEPPPPLREARSDLPPALDALVMRCLEKEASKRFPDVAHLAQALAPFGSLEVRASADRIGRVVRAKLPSSVDLAAEVSSTSVVHAPPPAVASQTAAAFGKTELSFVPRRSRALPLVASGAALAVAAVAGIVLLRGPAPVPAAATSGPASPVVTSPSPPPIAADPAPAPAPAPVPAPAPAPASASAIAPPAPSPVEPPSRPHAKPKPASPVAAASAPAPAAPAAPAKPAATSAFGGRD
jgi:serine/threonine-protein kinase